MTRFMKTHKCVDLRTHREPFTRGKRIEPDRQVVKQKPFELIDKYLRLIPGTTEALRCLEACAG